MKPLIQRQKSTPPFVISGLLASFALLPMAQAVVPPPDGGYPGFNTAEGTNALKNLTTGAGNTGLGWFSLFSDTGASFNTGVGAGSLLSNTANENTATGAGALLSNTTGGFNTAIGAFALLSNTTGNNNTATGRLALEANTVGDHNTASGSAALNQNTTGDNNTATGSGALAFNTSGSGNAAHGSGALVFNLNGSNNTATGFNALGSNTTGVDNTASGFSALFSTTTGNGNTADGDSALLSNTTGDQNKGLGVSALGNNVVGDRNTAVGAFALTQATSNLSTALGFDAGINVTTASNVICIGANVAGANVNDSCFIGNIYQKQVGGDSLPVRVDSFGKLGTEISSRRFKRQIRSMAGASETILALKPVIFQYRSDKSNTAQFGLVAEDVAEVNPDLVIRDRDGKPYSVRYEAVNAMLLNEFLKEHRKVEEQRRHFEGAFAQQQKQIDALTAGLQKVSAQLELSKAAPPTVLNHQ
jgi:trimeric autotransporter adhesin